MWTLLIAGLLAYAGVVVFVLVLCRAAARGDRHHAWMEAAERLHPGGEITSRQVENQEKDQAAYQAPPAGGVASPVPVSDVGIVTRSSSASSRSPTNAGRDADCAGRGRLSASPSFQSHVIGPTAPARPAR